MRALRLIPRLAVLGFLSAVLIQGRPAAADPLDKLGGAAQAAVHGELVLMTGVLPAVWSYDYAQQRILIDIEVQEGLHSWALLDWSGEKPTGFIGREDGCFSFALHSHALPGPQAFSRLLAAPPNDAARVSPTEIPEGVTAVRDRAQGETFLVMKEEAAMLLFRARSASPLPYSPDFAKDTSRCQPLSDLTAKIAGATSRRPAPDEKTTGKPTGKSDHSSRVEYNHPYTFRGLIYGGLKYKGHVFSQTRPQYQTALQTCTDAGPNECKPYYETGGWFGRYGYHCGDGWGGGHNKQVSGQDYCCYLHDRQEWGTDQAQNLCGFAACMTCKYYTNFHDWEQNFRGDFWAQKAIAVYVSAGVAAVLCHPQSYVTGFTCD